MPQENGIQKFRNSSLLKGGYRGVSPNYRIYRSSLQISGRDDTGSVTGLIGGLWLSRSARYTKPLKTLPTSTSAQNGVPAERQAVRLLSRTDSVERSCYGNRCGW